MDKDLLKAKDHLLKNGYKIVAVKDGEVIFTSDEPGIKGLLNILEKNEEYLKDSSVADKVIGRAAAFLMCFGNISRVFAPIISESALSALQKEKIEVHFDRKVDFIKNRTGDGICPMEKKCLDIEEPREAYFLLSGQTNGGNDK